MAIFFEAFDGGDRSSCDGADGDLAGTARRAGDEHGASAALAFAAAVFCAGEAEVVAENVQQRRVRGVMNGIFLAVYFKCDGVRHIFS